MKLKYSTNFYLEKRKDKKTNLVIIDNVPIILFFSFNGKRLQYFSGYRIDKSKWDKVEQKVKQNNFNRDGISATVINSHLEKLKSKVADIYTECKALNQTPSIQFIRDELKNRTGENEKALSFFDVFKTFIDTESQTKTWTKGTITKFNTILSQLRQFQARKHYHIEFDSINETFFNKYISFQRETLGHRNTTIAKNLKIFRWFLNWTTKKGYNKNLSYKDYDLKLKGTTRNQNIIFLTWIELMKLYNLTIPKNYLEQVRDVFCFSCFSGLRYSDLYNLKRSNIKTDTIEFTTIKTDETLIIDLNDYSRKIIDKYKDYPFKNEKCLPVISNQKMNEYLKELGRYAGINQSETIVYYKGAERIEETYQKWELLSSHAGRKTFISNALFLNIPSEVIMAWTGHKDHKVMENYYKIIAPQKIREMNKFNQE